MKKGCQQKQSAGDKLPSDEEKTVEQEENYCKISKLNLQKMRGETNMSKWIWKRNNQKPWKRKTSNS